MTCGGVDNECEDTGQGWQRYGDSVVGGSYDEQRSDVTETNSQDQPSSVYCEQALLLTPSPYRAVPLYVAGKALPKQST